MNAFHMLFIVACTGVLVAVVLLRAQNPTTNSTPASSMPATKDMPAGTVFVKVFNSKGELVGPIETPIVIKSEEEWRKRLTPQQCHIVREEGTERPFTSELLKNKDAGVYACIACDLPLFLSETKFDSGTGWPSFWQSIAPENIHKVEDRKFGMLRIETECARCRGHLGHVFDDGPRPSGLRYCINGLALKFIPAAEVAKTLRETD